MSDKNQAALILFIVGLVYQIFPSFAKQGIFSEASTAQVGLATLMLFLTAVILYFLPEKNK